jgi:hypothetical protein
MESSNKLVLGILVVNTLFVVLTWYYAAFPRDGFYPTPGNSAALQWGMIRDDTGFLDKRAGNIIAESQRTGDIEGMLGSEQPGFWEPVAGLNDSLAAGMNTGDSNKQIAAWNSAMGKKEGMKAPAYVDRMSVPKVQGQVLDPY